MNTTCADNNTIQNIYTQINSLMKKSLFVSLLLCLLSAAAYGQADTAKAAFKNYVKVDSIYIRGNDNTQKDVIMRELTFKIKDTVNAKILKYNEERIYSLGIFSQVKILPITSEGRNDIVIDVKESWYVWPIPFAQLTDNSWKKLTYGLDLNLKNLQGENQVVRSRIGLGYNPFVSLFYYNPDIIKSKNVYFSSSMNYNKVANVSDTAKKLYGADFDQKFISASLTFGKRIGLFNYVAVTGGFQYVETPKYVKGISVSGGRVDRIAIATLSYQFDSRDLVQFPKNGTFTGVNYSFKGMGISNVDYKILDFDFREYRGLWGDLSGKWRFFTRQIFGDNVPYFDYSYLGYGERVRGHYATKEEGNSSYLTSLEFQYPVVRDINLDFNFPIIPKRLQSFRVALFIQAFYDAGATRYRGANLMLNKFMTGYGLGLTVLVLPYNLARVECALDEKGNPEWNLGVGVSF